MDDELYLDRYNRERSSVSRGGMYSVYEADFAALDYRNQDGYPHQRAIREKEDALIHSALERIARARSKGKNNVNLSEEEMEALERRRDQQPEPPRSALASPPPTPAKKGKASSRSNSNSSLASKARKRSSGLFGGSSSPAKSSSKTKANSSRRGSLSPPNGMMLQGPIVAPAYGPLAYYGPPYANHAASRPSSKPVSRSGSKQSRRQSTPPDQSETYAPQYYYPPPRMRPDSAGSNRSLPDEVDWSPPTSRHRSTSNVQYPGYYTDYDGAAAFSAAQSRRNVSGPPDVRYSQLRRAPPASNALATRPSNKHSSHSDPAMIGRKSSGLSQQIADSSSSSESSGDNDDDDDDDDEGVHVELLRDSTNGYGRSVARAALPAPPSSGMEGRRRRSGRK